MKPPLRIAILECDTPLDNTRAKYGGYGGVFQQMLERGADALRDQRVTSKEGLELKKYQIVEQDIYPKLEDVDAILLTGSSMRNCCILGVEWQLIEYLQDTMPSNQRLGLLDL